MKFVTVLLLWVLVLVVPCWLGQMTLDAKWLKTTETIVSLYPGYLSSLLFALGISLVVPATALRVLLWALGFHILISFVVFPMPGTFVLGMGLGIVISCLSARISTRIIVRQSLSFA